MRLTLQFVQHLPRSNPLHSFYATHVMHNPYAYFTYSENSTALLIIYFRMHSQCERTLATMNVMSLSSRLIPKLFHRISRWGRWHQCPRACACTIGRNPPCRGFWIRHWLFCFLNQCLVTEYILILHYRILSVSTRR
jgi:hypothetical protein